MSEEGFMKLKESGGFELLRCHSSTRTLTQISCKWNADELKKNVNPQANVYIRPIQKNLSTKPIQTPDQTEETSHGIKCMKCGKEFNARLLREHLMNACNEDSTTCTQELEENDMQQQGVENIIFVQDMHQSTDNVVQIFVDDENIQEQSILHGLSSTGPEESSDDLPNLIHTPREQRVVTESTHSSGLPVSSSRIVSTEIEITANVVIKFCQDNIIIDPVEILRKIQLEMVTGRQLEIEDATNFVEGETNFIMVDRLNLLQTAKDEIDSLTNLRPTLEVQFYNEVAVDNGGPRKEFFRLCMQEIKEKYFDNGLRELISDQYIFVGKLFALSIVQNGTIPAFLQAEVIQEMFYSDQSQSSCISNIQIGMDALGLYTVCTYMICKSLPSLVFIFQSKLPALTMKRLTHLLQPKFSEEGSNANSFEKTVYAAFLRYLRNVARRQLEIEDATNFVEGETNFIMVDRLNLLQTAKDEIDSLTNLRPTLEVQFYNEVAVDNGGPRKEFFRLCMQEIKEKYFDNGLRELISDQYIFVGKLFALSIVQNGTIPAFLQAEVIQEMFYSDQSQSSCISNIQIGMDALGLYTVCTYMICKSLPSLVFIFQSKLPALTMKRLTHLLQPKFSEEGSNANSFEKTVYAAFLRYLRNVASGSRNQMSLEKVLQFVTGASEEPVLGFNIHPCIEFNEVETSFLPTANTCIGSLRLPRPSPNTKLLVDEDLFKMYDFAFTSEFYGLT
ncbi:hypothetical protein FSP39_001460 [Pinctada imbricata]|uniref:HECT-type E3 ubiquitin transferase n=1 Tax=Pinctada imbricata TaxID=66713 RepID=A0AA88YAE9_PINIB|nr:hypothetical protein FSP39_001460 [Pinctada imbricata]